MITSLTRRLIRDGLLRRASAYGSWSSSAIVFAPHPDDETLGCGGTLSKKLLSGAELHVAFMTDGSRSHEGRISPEKLRGLRRSEAEAACRELGLAAEHLVFLEIEDGCLDRQFHQAAAKVRELLERRRPEEVFVPYHADEHPDHVATRRIVLQALSELGLGARIFEYPVWFWNHWPWVRFSRTRAGARALWHAAGPSRHMWYRELRCAADVRETVAVKRAALSRHRSQMERLDGDPAWPILPDVSDGEWLECFFGRHELFYGYVLPERARGLS